MDIAAINGAGVIAGMSAVLFLLVAKAWTSLSRKVGSGPDFADSMMYEAAQRLRNEYDRLSTSQSIFLGGALVFAVLFAAAYVLEAGKLFTGYPDWQLRLQLGFLVFAAVFAVVRLATTAAKRHRVQFLRDACIAIGHKLQRIANEDLKIFHDYETRAGLIDHVVVSRSGLYAVSVVAKRARGNGAVCMDGNALVFPSEAAPRDIENIVNKARQLETEFHELLGYEVRVRSVIAVPGWKVTDQKNEKLLIVNEKDISNLAKWKSNSELLMRDDLDRLIAMMTARNSRSAKSAAS